jgi:hypothetical protein
VADTSSFKGVSHGLDAVSGGYEIYWLCYSLAMPAYEKAVALLDTFDSNHVLKQEFEHSRVHSELNLTYMKSAPITLGLIKKFWRTYFGYIHNSSFNKLLIVGELALHFNCINSKQRLEIINSAKMSSSLKNVIVYHDMEEIEHGADLVELLDSKRHIIAYVIHDIVFSFLLRFQSLVVRCILDFEYTFKNLLPKFIKMYIINPIPDINLMAPSCAWRGRYMPNDIRDSNIKEYRTHAKELFGLTLDDENQCVRL